MEPEASADPSRSRPPVAGPPEGEAPVDQTVPAPVHRSAPSPVDLAAPAPADLTAPAPVDQPLPAPADETAPPPADEKPPESAGERPPESAGERPPATAGEAAAARSAHPPTGSRAATGSTAQEAPIVARGVTKDFGDGAGIHDLDLVVPRGSILGLVGPSGAGKTTTIRLLTGALEPSSGEVRVLGQDPRRFRRAVRERIGYMPQLFTLYPELTAEENVDFVASLFGLLWRRRRRRVAEVLRLVELYDARRRRAARLSGGMQRRLELACALVHEPELLFLDEPTAGIDPLLRRTIWEELHRLKEQRDRTLLVTTQYVTEAEECDRVALVADGRLIAFDTPEALRRDALGGDLLEVETTAPFDPATLLDRSGVRRVEPRGLRSFWIAVDDGAAMLPVIDDLVREVGGDVTGAREIRPSFDEVFAALVQRATGARSQADAATEAASHAAEAA